MDWNTEHASSSSVFAPLRIHGGAAFGTAWPALEDFQKMIDARVPPVVTGGGRPLTLVRQSSKPASFEERYEARIYLRGELQVRASDLHDYFNVLAWLAFPRAKAALNARHFEALKQQVAVGVPNRGPAQDALTLFDEGGLVVVSSDSGLLRLLREWRWKELYWENRGRLAARMQFFLFGHAVYQKMLRPFLGITCRAIVLEAEPGLLSAQLPQRLAEVDARAAAYIADPSRMLATRELAVVPVLGYPGWHPENETAGFYDNKDYFRSQRSREKRG